MNKIEYHKKLCDDIHTLYINKNNDYGDSVNDTFEKFGIDAFLVRMYDKINRVYSLTRTQAEAKVQDEKVEDTLEDLANYALIALVELKNKRDNLVCSADVFRDVPSVDKEALNENLNKFKMELN